jgi:L-ascorbate metabolism protein UlaG (beta-lactamase superfamily)
MTVISLLLACNAEQPASETTPPVAAPETTPPETAPPAEAAATEAKRPKADVIQTSGGPLSIQPIGHGTVAFDFGGKTWVVDPSSEPGGDYAGIKADVVLITDIHPDHMDKAQLAAVSKPDATVVAPAAVQKELGADVDVVIANGETKEVAGVKVEATPMYNLTRGPEAGKLFHDKGRGNGYIVTFGDKRIYLSGDTECTAEMKAVKNIDVAFVVMNLPYTMPPEEAAGCITEFDPKIVYPYHYGDSDLAKLTVDKETEVRVRDWYMTKAK